MLLKKVFQLVLLALQDFLVLPREYLSLVTRDIIHFQVLVHVQYAQLEVIVHLKTNHLYNALQVHILTMVQLLAQDAHLQHNTHLLLDRQVVHLVLQVRRV